MPPKGLLGGIASTLRLCFYLTFQYPPLAGPMRSMMPSALSLARCFSMAFAEMPISLARAAALNLPSWASKVTIFSLLFWVFSLLFVAKIMFSPYFFGFSPYFF